ncbi:MAG: TatD family hydrolase [Solirubrobacterales bacterium]
MIDTHCHLNACEQPVAELVDNARDAGVRRMLAIGMTNDSCRHALGTAAKHNEVFVAIGRHPHETEGWDDGDLVSLHELAVDPRARAIGETGLDYKRDYAPRSDQRAAFIAQMELATELDRPLVIHTRFAADDTLALLDRHAAGPDVIIHCFSLTDHVDVCIERGYYCSFAGNVTYPKATELHDAAMRVPDDLLLVETDAPFLAPQRWRGRPNEPARVVATAEFLAELRGTTYDNVEQVVERNAARLFGW